MTEQSSVEAQLCLLCDPEAAVPELSDDEAGNVLEFAFRRRVGPIVFRKLGHRDLPVVQKMKERTELLAVLAMRLEALAVPIKAAIKADNLAATIVKGESFAKHLYQHQADRPFTDIDILAAQEAKPALERILRDLGYQQHLKEFMDQSENNDEQKWYPTGQKEILVELQGNLVHQAGLRKHVSLGYSDLMRVDATNPEAPLCLFFIAIAHASLGHKFQMRLMIDVLQAYRNLGADDRAALPEMTKKMRMRLETATSLDLIARLFNNDDVREMGQKIALPIQSRIAHQLIDPAAVMSATTHKMRRRMFRGLQLLHIGRG